MEASLHSENTADNASGQGAPGGHASDENTAAASHRELGENTVR